MENRRATHSVIKQKFEEAGYNVSTRTVMQNLYDMGFKCRRPINKPRLTPAMVKKRLEWAYAHRHLTIEDWRIVCFSDESTFQILDDKVKHRRRSRYLRVVSVLFVVVPKCIWRNAIADDMESAGIEEKRIAVEKGHVDDDGIPYIDVYVDGEWSKRSYGHSYNANSGAAIIVGR